MHSKVAYFGLITSYQYIRNISWLQLNFGNPNKRTGLPIEPTKICPQSRGSYTTAKATNRSWRSQEKHHISEHGRRTVKRNADR